MRNSTILRLSLLAAALGASLCAQAFEIHIFRNPTTGILETFSSLPGLASDFIYDGTVFADGGISLSISAHGAGLLAQSVPGASHIDKFAGTTSFSGLWSTPAALTTNLGLAPNQVLEGTYSGSYDVDNSATYTFVGSVEAVPEPASLLALGLPAVALLRRRRRA